MVEAAALTCSRHKQSARKRGHAYKPRRARIMLCLLRDLRFQAAQYQHAGFTPHARTGGRTHGRIHRCWRSFTSWQSMETERLARRRHQYSIAVLLCCPSRISPKIPKMPGFRQPFQNGWQPNCQRQATYQLPPARRWPSWRRIFRWRRMTFIHRRLCRESERISVLTCWCWDRLQSLERKATSKCE